MHRMRHGVALVIVAALAAFTLGALRPPEQVVVAMPVTTTTTTTTVLPTTTTTTTGGVDREAEIEEILRDFYFGWFDGIYRQDVDTLDRVAGSTEVFESGVAAFGKPKYTAQPTREAVGVKVKNVLLDRPDCLVVSADIDFRSFIDIDRVMPAVDVFFRVGDRWGRAVSYQYEKEMWQFACDFMPRR
ncbi:MAG: hypothetical protein WEA76_07930 [Acidimicrobiia bacterium]